MLSFFVTPNNPKDSAFTKQRTDSVLVKVFDGQQKQIRSFKAKADTGLNRIYWNFETISYRQPGSSKPKPGSPELGNGIPAFPGTYKAVFTLGKETDSATITVNPDPRVDVKKEVYDAKKQMIERLQVSVDKFAAAVDNILDAEETITKLEANLKGAEGKDADSLRRAVSAMKADIKKLREPIFGRSSEKQGINRFGDRTTMSVLQVARVEVMGKMSAPTTQTERLMKEAEDEIEKTVQAISTFFSTKWTAFRKQAEATPLKLFKD